MREDEKKIIYLHGTYSPASGSICPNHRGPHEIIINNINNDSISFSEERHHSKISSEGKVSRCESDNSHDTQHCLPFLLISHAFLGLPVSPVHAG